jgi:hypothetical protein
VDLNFDDLINILDGEEFDEKPVDLKTFVRDPQYLGLPELSEYKYIKSQLLLNYLAKKKVELDLNKLQMR